MKLVKGAKGQDTQALMTLRDKLVGRINSYELNLNEQTQNLQLRLEKREFELDQVKQLFVDKLRQLESNFAEIGDHLIANQQKQKEQSEIESKKQERDENHSIIMDVLKDDDSDKDGRLEELVQANNQLNDLADELKQRLKTYVSQD